MPTGAPPVVDFWVADSKTHESCRGARQQSEVDTVLHDLEVVPIDGTQYLPLWAGRHTFDHFIRFAGGVSAPQ